MLTEEEVIELTLKLLKVTEVFGTCIIDLPKISKREKQFIESIGGQVYSKVAILPLGTYQKLILALPDKYKLYIL